MKLRALKPGEYRYAVAVEDGADLWLTLWVRRAPNGQFFVMLPRNPIVGLSRNLKKWDPHASYHLSGALHRKSYDRVIIPQTCQPLTSVFLGTVDLGYYAGHDPKSVGEICDPKDFSGVVKVAPGVLEPGQGEVKVDLIEPGQEPPEFEGKVINAQVFRDVLPWIVIRVGRRIET
jgi:hypothetical protein